MKVSVIIAVYKDVEALELIIESLKNQTYKNFEHIFIDGFSNDGTWKVPQTLDTFSMCY